MSRYRAREGAKVNTEGADLATLRRLADASPGRRVMKAFGFVQAVTLGDLHRYGYNLKAWIIPGVAGSLVYEYLGRQCDGGTHRGSVLPRIVVDSYEDQAELHRAIGATVTGRGSEWADHGKGQLGLFG